MPPKVHLSLNADGPISQAACGWLGSRVTQSVQDVSCYLCRQIVAQRGAQAPQSPTEKPPARPRYGRGCHEPYPLSADVPDSPWPTWRSAVRHYIAVCDDGWASRSPSDPERFEAIPDGVYRNDGDKAQRQALKLANISKALDEAYSNSDFEGLQASDCLSVLVFMVCGRPVRVHTQLGRDGPKRKQTIVTRVPVTKQELAKAIERSPHVVTAIHNVGAHKISGALFSRNIISRQEVSTKLDYDVIGRTELAQRFGVSVSTMFRMLTYQDHGLPIEFIDGKWRARSRDIAAYLKSK